MNDSRYYARNEKEKKFDDRIREAAKNTGDPYKMAMFVQGQAQLNLLRRIDDKIQVIKTIKGYPVPNGYAGWIEEENMYRLFASEADYREYLEEEDA